MPWLSPHPCREPGCGILIRGKAGRCVEHSKQQRKRDDENRPAASERGYGPDWRKRRAEFLAEHEFCVRCGDPSTVADHIVPLRDGGADHESNWQPLCKPCHDSWKQRIDRATRSRVRSRHGG